MPQRLCTINKSDSAWPHALRYIYISIRLAFDVAYTLYTYFIPVLFGDSFFSFRFAEAKKSFDFFSFFQILFCVLSLPENGKWERKERKKKRAKLLCSTFRWWHMSPSYSHSCLPSKCFLLYSTGADDVFCSQVFSLIETSIVYPKHMTQTLNTLFMYVPRTYNPLIHNIVDGSSIVPRQVVTARLKTQMSANVSPILSRPFSSFLRTFLFAQSIGKIVNVKLNANTRTIQVSDSNSNGHQFKYLISHKEINILFTFVALDRSFLFLDSDVYGHH